MIPTIPQVRVGGLPISRLCFSSTVTLVSRWLASDGHRRVATANLDFLRLAHEDPGFRSALATCDLVTADGWPVVWLARRAGREVPERVAGSDLVPALAAECARTGRSIHLFGGHEGTAEEAAARLVERHPGLRIAGTASPRVDLRDEAACARAASEIRATRADLLLVGLGAPKQDLFLARWLPATGCRVGIGVGGTFDFLAGRIRRAPRAVRAVGMEWAWRMAKEPRRLVGRYAADAAHLAKLVAAR